MPEAGHEQERIGRDRRDDDGRAQRAREPGAVHRLASFPVGVIGSSATTSKLRGTMYAGETLAAERRELLRRRRGCAGASTISATGSSPRCAMLLAADTRLRSIGRMRVEHGFDFLAEELHAGHVDARCAAAGQAQVAVVVEPALVAGAKAVGLEDRRGRRPRIEIRVEHAGTADADLAAGSRDCGRPRRVPSSARSHTS